MRTYTHTVVFTVVLVAAAVVWSGTNKIFFNVIRL